MRLSKLTGRKVADPSHTRLKPFRSLTAFDITSLKAGVQHPVKKLLRIFVRPLIRAPVSSKRPSRGWSFAISRQWAGTRNRNLSAYDPLPMAYHFRRFALAAETTIIDRSSAKRGPSGIVLMPDFLTICEQAARAGGAVLLDWAQRFTVREKGPSDLVTEADIASQEMVRRILSSAFPEHEFLSEEDPAAPAESASQPRDSAQILVSSGPDRYRWIVDPLDGTTNYVHRIPEFAVSIALEQRGKVLVGCVFNPVAEDCYTASRGGGAFLNGRRLAVSRATELSQALIAVSFPPKVKPDSRVLADFARVIVACQSIRRTGSAALNLCYVAAGRFDGYWARETKIWDVAAGSLMIQEAGGVMTGLEGTPFQLARPQFIAAATAPLHRELRAIVG